VAKSHGKGEAMRRSPLVFVIAALLLGIAVAGGFYYHYRQSPRFALHQMVNALMYRNYKEFYTYLDLNNILSHLMQETGKDLIPSEIPEGDYLTQFGWKMGRKFAQNLLPRILQTVEKNLHSIINKYLDTLTTEDFLALEAAVALADISQTGDEAQVTLKFPKGDAQLRLTMFRSLPKRGWRVVSVNYKDLKNLLKKELF
jgi:hypothetical protein